MADSESSVVAKAGVCLVLMPGRASGVPSGRRRPRSATTFRPYRSRGARIATARQGDHPLRVAACSKPDARDAEDGRWPERPHPQGDSSRSSLSPSPIS